MNCPICKSRDTFVAYHGPIRNGTWPNTVEGHIYECHQCYVQWLDESLRIKPEDYTSGKYRELVGEDNSAENFLLRHMKEQQQRLNVFPLEGFVGKTVIDVGAGGGAFLSAIKGVAKETIAIEPNVNYHDALRKQGHRVFGRADSCHYHADVVTSFATIEHVADPVGFMADLASLTKSGGRIIISTPNVDYFLIEISKKFKSFWYRVQHNWYFDWEALIGIIHQAGLENELSLLGTKFGQSTDFDNFIGWVSDSGVENYFNNIIPDWQERLARTSEADTLYLELIREPE